jgi:UDP-3-O-[3-hydroxymyristoyl] glucosamine N-acyltransferase
VKTSNIFLIKASILAADLGCDFRGEDREITGVSSLFNPLPSTIGFARRGMDLKVQNFFIENGGVLITSEVLDDSVHGCVLLSADPEFDFSRAIEILFDYKKRMNEGFILVTKSAEVHSKDFRSHCSEFGIEIGRNTVIQPGVVLGPNVRIGDNCLIKSGAIIGGPGFGSFRSSSGNNMHMPHVGGVTIESYVEIGALTTVCSGTIEPTFVEERVHIDDHVHIAHNVRVGLASTITAGCVIGGGVYLGKECWLGIGSTLRDGITISENVFIGMGSLVTKDLTTSGRYIGRPARLVG